MDSFFLLVGLFGLAIGLIAYYASVHDKVNALGRFTKPAAALVLLCGIILIGFGVFS